MLLLHPLGPLDVDHLVILQLLLVGVLGSVNDPGPVPLPEGQLLDLSVEDSGHLAAEAVVHVQGLVLSLRHVPRRLQLEVLRGDRLGHRLGHPGAVCGGLGF